jgi:hypothetical protein
MEKNSEEPKVQNTEIHGGNPVKKYHVRLMETERKWFLEITKKGNHPTRQIIRTKCDTKSFDIADQDMKKEVNKRNISFGLPLPCGWIEPGGYLPGTPQTRTCPIKVSGSSGKRFA